MAATEVAMAATREVTVVTREATEEETPMEQETLMAAVEEAPTELVSNSLMANSVEDMAAVAVEPQREAEIQMNAQCSSET